LRFKNIRWVVTGGTVSSVWPEPLSTNYSVAFQTGQVAIYRRNE